MNDAIVTEHLIKIYNDGTKALDDISINIKSKGITCILGRNGAGKTTFLRIVGTQLLPTSGKFIILGYDGIREANEIRKRIAVVPQEARTFNINMRRLKLKTSRCTLKSCNTALLTKSLNTTYAQNLMGLRCARLVNS